MNSLSHSPDRVGPAALQRRLPIADPRLRVLVTINGARDREAFRGYDEDDILWLIENRYLVAFNIALHVAPVNSPDRVGPARELRILPDSLDWCAKNESSIQHPESSIQNPFFATWDRLILTGHLEETLTSTRLGVILNCGATHVTNLLDSGALLPINQLSTKHYRPGRNGAAHITRDSFLSFLKSRLEGQS